MQVFRYEQKNITTIKINDDIYFKAYDIATVLGYNNKQQAIRLHVDNEDIKNIKEIPTANFEQSKKIANNTKFINESGVYSLILRSNLPTAKQFKRWITKDVIPSIRRTGEYKLINKDEQDIKKINKIKLGFEFLDSENFLSDRDKSYLLTQVKNIVMNDKLITDKDNENKNDEYEYPLTRRLLDHGIRYTDKQKGLLISCGKYLKRLYFKKHNKLPLKRNQYVDGAIREVNIYTNKDFDILDEALRKYFIW